VTPTPAALYFDFTSPASVVAVLRLETLRARGAQISFVGIDVLGLAIAVPLSARLDDERQRWASDAHTLGVTLNRPAWQPPTLKAHLITPLAQAANVADIWRRQVFHAYWQDGLAIDDDTVLADVANASGVERGQVEELLNATKNQAALTQQMTQNRRRGIGDVPVLEVHGNFISPHLSDPDLAAVLMVQP
jgi:2-hydroxychromene-2-carboxylate isomerase